MTTKTEERCRDCGGTIDHDWPDRRLCRCCADLERQERELEEECHYSLRRVLQRARRA